MQPSHRLAGLGLFSATLIDLPVLEAQLVVALRVAACAGKAGRDVDEHLTERLGSPAASARFSVLVATLADVWPETFHLSRPCCGKLTHDEWEYARLLRHCVNRNRPAFDRQLCDMIDMDSRDCLHDRFMDLIAVLDSNM
ncbi:MAG: hypothetical protein R3E02_14595 [Blastomonas sp.]